MEEFYQQIEDIVNDFIALDDSGQKHLFDTHNKLKARLIDLAATNLEEPEHLQEGYKTTLELETDLTIREMRIIAESFYFDEEEPDKDLVVRTAEEIEGVFLGYIKNQEQLVKLLEEKGQGQLDLYFYNKELAMAYESFLFMCEQFGINHMLAEHDLEIELELASKDLIEEFESVDKKVEQREKAVEKMYAFADSFYERHHSRASEHLFVEETVKKLVDIVTDELWDEFPDGDVNAAVIAFEAFNHLIQIKEIEQEYSRCFGESIDMEEIYKYIDDEQFVMYLQLIVQQKWNQAIELYPEYEIPYYYKLYNLLWDISSVNDVKGLTEEERGAILENVSHLKELYLVMSCVEDCGYLPTLSDNSNFVDIDFELFLTMVEYQSEIYARNPEFAAIIKERDEAIQEKNEMIQRYAHNWKHISYPKTVKDVASVLLKDNKYKSYGYQLMKAYNSETLLKQQSKMLVLRHSGGYRELQRAIRQDVYNPHSPKGIDMVEILESSLETIVFRVLMEDAESTYTVEEIKKSLFQGQELGVLRDDFINRFIPKAEGEDIVDWFSQNIYPLNLSLDENWRSVSLKPESAAVALLVEIMVELLFNALNYGVKTGGYLDLKLATREESTGDYLTIRTKNPVDYQHVLEPGTGTGISSLRKLLFKLNYSTKHDMEQLDFLTAKPIPETNLYTTEIMLKKNLFIKKVVSLI